MECCYGRICGLTISKIAINALLNLRNGYEFKKCDVEVGYVGEYRGIDGREKRHK